MANNPNYVTRAINLANKPFKEHRAAQQSDGASSGPKYIPGLTSKPTEETGPPKKDAPMRVPPSLITAFLDGSKQPISALNEYCSMVRSIVAFREVSVDRTLPSGCGMFSKFAVVCTVDNKAYPQGVGTTKKQAKTEAAKIAFTKILGCGVEDMEDEQDSGHIVFDSHGRKVALDLSEPVRIVKEVPKHVIPLMATDDIPPNISDKFHAYCKAKNKGHSLTVDEEPNNEGIYSASLIMDRELKSIGQGTTKKDAKHAAYASGLYNLQRDEEIKGNTVARETEYDRISKMMYMHLLPKMKGLPPKFAGGRQLAGFLIKKHEKDPGIVVALGTGTSCVKHTALSGDGRTLIDTHAVTNARRSLLRYIHKELKLWYDGQQVVSIFEQSQTGLKKLKLNSSVTLHLFLSDTPLGDASAFMDSHDNLFKMTANEEELIESGKHFPDFSHDLHGVLSCYSDEDIAPTHLPEDETWRNLLDGSPISVMSASDKIMKWNVLGVQGALLGNYVDPIYISTIIVGRGYEHASLTRAFCCRLSKELVLPMPYKVNHPRIATVMSFTPPKLTENNTRMSVNWMHQDDTVEIIDSTTGKSIEESPFKTSHAGASRLCKAGFLSRYKDLAKATNQKNLWDATSCGAAKQFNRPYQEAKKLLYRYLVQKNFGAWVRTNPAVDEFSK